MPTLTEIKNHKNQMIASAQSLVNEGKANTEEYRTLIKSIDEEQSRIDMLTRIEEIQGGQSRSTTVAAPAAIAPQKQNDENPADKMKRLDLAFRSLLRNGRNAQLPEQRDLTVNADGTATIPQEFDPLWTQALRYYGPIATLVKQAKQNNGRSRKLIVSDDSAATMNYLAETGSTGALSADPALISKIPGADALVTVVRFSYQELEDAANFDEFLADIAGLRVARAVEYALTLGKDNGTNTPLPNSPAGGLLGVVPTGATTASLTAGLGYTDFVNLVSSVDQAYFAAPNSGFMASPSVVHYLYQQKDSTSRPYYGINPNTGLLEILGKPVYVNASMPAYNAASSPVVLFGDFSRAYAYLNVGGVGIQVLKERYVVDTMQAAAVIHHRLGAATLVSGAVKALVTAAS